MSIVKKLGALGLSALMLIGTIAPTAHAKPPEAHGGGYSGSSDSKSGHGTQTRHYDEIYPIGGLGYTSTVHTPATIPYKHKMTIGGKQYLVDGYIGRALRKGTAEYVVYHPESSEPYEYNAAHTSHNASVRYEGYQPEYFKNGGNWSNEVYLPNGIPDMPMQLMGFMVPPPNNMRIQVVNTFVQPMAVPDGGVWGYPGTHGTFFRGGKNYTAGGGDYTYTTNEGSPGVIETPKIIIPPKLRVQNVYKDVLDDEGKVIGRELDYVIKDTHPDGVGKAESNGYIGYFGPLFKNELHVKDLMTMDGVASGDSLAEVTGTLNWRFDRQNRVDPRDSSKTNTDLIIGQDLTVNTYFHVATKKHTTTLLVDGRTIRTDHGENVKYEAKIPPNVPIKKDSKIEVVIEYEYTNNLISSSSGHNYEVVPDWNKSKKYRKVFTFNVGQDYKVDFKDKVSTQTDTFGKGKEGDNRWVVGADFKVEGSIGVDVFGDNPSTVVSDVKLEPEKEYYEWIEKHATKNTRLDSYALVTQTGIPTTPGAITYKTDLVKKPVFPYPSTGVHGKYVVPEIDETVTGNVYKYHQIGLEGGGNEHASFAGDISILSMKTGLPTKHNMSEVAKRQYKGSNIAIKPFVQNYVSGQLGSHKGKVKSHKGKEYNDTPLFTGVGTKSYEQLHPDLLQRWYLPVTQESKQVANSNASIPPLPGESRIPRLNSNFADFTNPSNPANMSRDGYYIMEAEIEDIGLNYGKMRYVVPYNFEYNLIGTGANLTAPYLLVAPKGNDINVRESNKKKLPLSVIKKLGAFQNDREVQFRSHGVRYGDHTIKGEVDRLSRP